MSALQPPRQRTLGSALSSHVGIEDAVDSSYWNGSGVWVTLETVPDTTGIALSQVLVVAIVWLMRTITVLRSAVDVGRLTILLGHALHLDVDHGWYGTWS